MSGRVVQSGENAALRRAGAPCVLHAQVLILLFSALFFGGSGHKSLDELVHEAVGDANRAKVAAEVAQRFEQTNADVVAGIVELRSELFRVLGDYDATEDDWRPVLDRASAHLANGEDDILQLRFDLRDTMTEEEWGRLFDQLRKEHVRMSY